MSSPSCTQPLLHTNSAATAAAEALACSAVTLESCHYCWVIAHLCEKVGLNLLEEDIVTMIVLPHIVLAAFITQHADLQQQRRKLLFWRAQVISGLPGITAAAAARLDQTQRSVD